MSLNKLPANLTKAYNDVFRAVWPIDALPDSASELTVDHLEVLRRACLYDIATLERSPIVPWDEDVMASKRLLAWTETQIKQVEK